MRDRQPVFARTGGCHAASLVTFAGEHVVTFEDVGRHNAVDKVIGSRVLAKELPLGGRVLFVSGRSSFEIALDNRDLHRKAKRPCDISRVAGSRKT